MKNYTLSKIVITSLCSLLLFSCNKDRYIFSMEFVKLNSFQKSKYPAQNLSIRVVHTNDPTIVLGSTGPYPANMTLPVTFAVNPSPHVHLYKDPVSIQLWGDSTGLIASSDIHMKEYKIIYPIDMETKNDSVSFSVLGSWE